MQNRCFFSQILRGRPHSTSPPGPLSIGWRGGTGVRPRRTYHLSLWPPLHRMERGNGGEVRQLVSGSATRPIHPEFWFRLRQLEDLARRDARPSPPGGHERSQFGIQSSDFLRNSSFGVRISYAALFANAEPFAQPDPRLLGRNIDNRRFERLGRSQDRQEY